MSATREDVTEAIAAVLRTSCAADGGCGDLRLLAADIAAVIDDLHHGATVRDAVLANWDLDEVQRREVFG